MTTFTFSVPIEGSRGAARSTSGQLLAMTTGTSEDFLQTQAASQTQARFQHSSSGASGKHMGGTEGPGSSSGLGIGAGGRGHGQVQASNRPTGTNVSWSSEEMQRLLLNRPDVKAQAQAIMGSRTLQDADKKLQIKELLKKLR